MRIPPSIISETLAFFPAFSSREPAGNQYWIMIRSPPSQHCHLTPVKNIQPSLICYPPIKAFLNKITAFSPIAPCVLWAYITKIKELAILKSTLKRCHLTRRSNSGTSLFVSRGNLVKIPHTQPRNRLHVRKMSEKRPSFFPSCSLQVPVEASKFPYYTLTLETYLCIYMSKTVILDINYSRLLP
jgi:hypothetical protein